ncbi:MAG TPA: glycosyltransferase family 39 protein [Frankiaceae bacterium]|nr:glycosyltransferase family 39 protein [Frankiaceae bacterium]
MAIPPDVQAAGATAAGPTASAEQPADGRPPASRRGARLARLGSHRAQRLALGAVLLLAAGLYLWRLDRNGYGNEYYSAAVRSMTQSWHNFFYVAFDPAGFISVGKPPLALWVQAASVKVFGFGSWSLLVPEALAGVAAVYVLYRVVRKAAGPVAGLLAALALALTPVTVATVRTNNTDAVMILLVVLAAWAATVATERGSGRLLAVAGVLVGLGFMTKMLQAYLVVPALALAYLVAAPVGLRRRVGHLLAAGAAMLAVPAIWVVAVDLTPAGSRPYVGSSTDNTVRDLVFGNNGLNRVAGNDGGTGGGQGRALAGLARGAQAGIGRLFGEQVGGQIAWLIPFAAAALLVGLLAVRRRPRTDALRTGLLLWSGWALCAWGVFSFSRGGFHEYYTSQLAPALAALAGMGAVLLARLARDGSRLAWPLAAGAAGSAVLGVVLLGRTPDWNAWLRPVVLALAGLAFLATAVVVLRRTVGRRWRAGAAVGAVGASVVAALAGPAAYAVAPITNPAPLALPSAHPAESTKLPGRAPATLSSGGPGASLPAGLLAYLERNRGGASYLVAMTGAFEAADVVITTGEPVMTMGGFSGIDPVPTADRLREDVRAGQVRYVLLGGGPGGTVVPATAQGREVTERRTAWVRQSSARW